MNRRPMKEDGYLTNRKILPARPSLLRINLKALPEVLENGPWSGKTFSALPILSGSEQCEKKRNYLSEPCPAYRLCSI